MWNLSSQRRGEIRHIKNVQLNSESPAGNLWKEIRSYRSIHWYIVRSETDEYDQSTVRRGAVDGTPAPLPHVRWVCFKGPFYWMDTDVNRHSTCAFWRSHRNEYLRKLPYEETSPQRLYKQKEPNWTLRQHVMQRTRRQETNSWLSKEVLLSQLLVPDGSQTLGLMRVNCIRRRLVQTIVCKISTSRWRR